MKISIIVPIRWSNERTGMLLKQLLCQKTSAQVEVIAVAVDQGKGKNGQGNFVSSWPPDVQVVCPKVTTPAAARNAGAQLAHGDFFLFIDDDCWPGTDWAQLMCMKADAEIAGVVGGLAAAVPNSLVEKYLGIYALALPEKACMYEQLEPFISFGHSANMMIRHDWFKKLGGFEEKWSTGEDHDLCYRLLSAGGRLCFQPKVTILHQHRSTITAMLKQAWGCGRGQTRIAKRHWPGNIIILRSGKRPFLLSAYKPFSVASVWEPFSSLHKFYVLLLLALSLGWHLHWVCLTIPFFWWLRLGNQLARRLQRESLTVSLREQFTLPIIHLARQLSISLGRSFEFYLARGRA